MGETAVSCQALDNYELDVVSITPQEYNDILAIQQKILGMIASHGDYKNILGTLCTLAEKLLPNSVASIMLTDKKTGLMSVLSAPSIPQVGHDALKNLQPGPGGGSCGNAVFHNEAQYVLNTFEDPRWEDLRQTAIDFNLCSCWSMPVKDENSQAIGTFALSSFEHRSPAPFHKKLLETAAFIVNIVLKNQDDERKIELFSTAAQHAVEGMIITDKDNNIIEVNQAFMDIYGYSQEQVLGKNPRILASRKHNKKFYDDMWNHIKTQNQYSCEIINQSSTGEEIVQWISISALYDENNNAHNYLAIFSDLTAIKEAHSKIHEMAFHDSLTGLYNKSYLEQLLGEHKNKTLILLNVNNFSYINTAYGFEVGDKLLIRIAKILEENFSTEATCRINSDEYALLFDKKIDIENIVLDIKKCFYSQEINIESVTLNISFSYGATFGSTNRLSNSALALKQAKENGRNNLYIYTQDKNHADNSKRESFIEINNLLHSALNEDKIVPYFQGIRNNETKQIKKFESLARIIDNDEIISPYKFIEIAKLSGLLSEITKVMIEKTFKVMSTNDYMFSINITEDDLHQDYLGDYLKEKAQLYKITPNRVILEILEGISSDGKKSHIKQLKHLKDDGYSIAIDDFGTEYSNFERILDLDIDFLKIDAKYIKNIHTSKKSYEITRAIIFFAKNAGIPCIAEFVHNKEVQEIIEALGIDYSQGYYFSEPTDIPITQK
jgi:PAS domain S-box-containing protein/diguanylate cyclase (GGDEF)-like protein